MIEYRIIWDDDGNGNVWPGPWAPLSYLFDHHREAEQNAGRAVSGTAVMDTRQALQVEFRMR